MSHKPGQEQVDYLFHMVKALQARLDKDCNCTVHGSVVCIYLDAMCVFNGDFVRAVAFVDGATASLACAAEGESK